MKPEYVGDSPQFISNPMQKSLVKIFHLMPDFIRLKLKSLVEIILGSGCAYFTEAVPAKYFSNLKSIDFYNMKVNIPVDSEGYLAHQFGDDWRTPKKDWVPAQLELVRDGKSIQKAWKLVKP